MSERPDNIFEELESIRYWIAEYSKGKSLASRLEAEGRKEEEKELLLKIEEIVQKYKETGKFECYACNGSGGKYIRCNLCDGTGEDYSAKEFYLSNRR